MRGAALRNGAAPSEPVCVSVTWRSGVKDWGKYLYRVIQTRSTDWQPMQ